jgi:aspartyl-tRNA synthetase
MACPNCGSWSVRADRSLEFYQLDVEMSFVTQEDVFAAIEPVLAGVFEEFRDFSGTKRAVTASSDNSNTTGALLRSQA